MDNTDTMDTIAWALSNGWTLVDGTWTNPDGYGYDSSNLAFHLMEIKAKEAKEAEEAEANALTVNDLILEARGNVSQNLYDYIGELDCLDYQPEDLDERQWHGVATYLAGLIAAERNG